MSQLPANYVKANRFNNNYYYELQSANYAFHNTPITTAAHGFRNSDLSYAHNCFRDCNSLTSIYFTFAYCRNLTNVDDIIPYNVTQLAGCFANHYTFKFGWDITIYSPPKITNMVNTVRGYGGHKIKNIKIYFKYANEVNSATYNQFKANNVYKGISGNGAGVDPMYNFYVYNLGIAPF